MIEIDTGRSLLTEINQFVEIHFEVFEKEISTALGKKYLTSVYEIILEEEDTVVFYERDKEKIIGFIVYTKGTPSLTHGIHLNELFNFFIRTLQTPSLILKLFIQFLIPTKKKDSNFFEISFFAVRKGFQSKGTGKDLLNELLIYSRKTRINNIITKTSNKNLLRFYLNNFNSSVDSVHGFRFIKYYLIKINP